MFTLHVETHVKDLCTQPKNWPGRGCHQLIQKQINFSGTEWERVNGDLGDSEHENQWHSGFCYYHSKPEFADNLNIINSDGEQIFFSQSNGKPFEIKSSVDPDTGDH